MDRKKNRWKYGIWSAFVTILGVLLAVILVWVAERATERFGLKFEFDGKRQVRNFRTECFVAQKVRSGCKDYCSCK